MTPVHREQKRGAARFEQALDVLGMVDEGAWPGSPAPEIDDGWDVSDCGFADLDRHAAECRPKVASHCWPSSQSCRPGHHRQAALGS